MKTDSENPTIPVHKGGCLCGKIRYSVVGDPMQIAICHCINCQLNSGSAFSVSVVFPKEALTMTGDYSVYQDSGATGESVGRVFCGTCGTPLESRSVFSKQQYAVLKAGTFDNPADFVPESEIYCSTALPWWEKSGKRKCYDRLNTDAIPDVEKEKFGL